MARVSKSKCTKHLSWAFLGSWDVEKCMGLWREARLEVKCLKRLSPGALLEVKMFKKCTPFWREAHFEVKMCKTHHGRTTFGSSSVVLCGRRYGFCSSCKNDAGRGTFEALQRCISRGRRSTSDIFIRDVGRFLRGVASWSIRSSGLPSNWAWQAQHFVWPGLAFSVAGAIL